MPGIVGGLLALEAPGMLGYDSAILADDDKGLLRLAVIIGAVAGMPTLNHRRVLYAWCSSKQFRMNGPGKRAQTFGQDGAGRV